LVLPRESQLTESAMWGQSGEGKRAANKVFMWTERSSGRRRKKPDMRNGKNSAELY